MLLWVINCSLSRSLCSYTCPQGTQTGLSHFRPIADCRILRVPPFSELKPNQLILIPKFLAAKVFNSFLIFYAFLFLFILILIHFDFFDLESRIKLVWALAFAIELAILKAVVRLVPFPMIFEWSYFRQRLFIWYSAVVHSLILMICARPGFTFAVDIFSHTVGAWDVCKCVKIRFVIRCLKNEYEVNN